MKFYYFCEMPCKPCTIITVLHFFPFSKFISTFDFQAGIHCRGLPGCKLLLMQLEDSSTSMSTLFLYISTAILNLLIFWLTKTFVQRLWKLWFLHQRSNVWHIIALRSLSFAGSRLWTYKANWRWKYLFPYTPCGYFWLHASRVSVRF